jgi:hypothetical protein
MDTTTYLNNQPVTQEQKEKDNELTKAFKQRFSFFAPGSLLYAIFYTLCLYRNASGITYPFFVVGTLFYFFFSIQKLGVPYKKDSIFYLISLVLLGMSNCLTTSPQLLFMNKCGIFLLAFFLMLHTFYQDRSWNLPKYFSALFQTLGSCVSCICLFRLLSDLMSYFDAQNSENTAMTEKKNYLIPVMIGFTITVPLLFVITALLYSADVVFAQMIKRILKFFNFTTVFEILFLIIAVFFVSYAVYAALCMKNVTEKTEDKRTFEPVIAIIMTTALSAVYLIFSGIQIMYLFIGKMQLPEGYTYSSYAREGFFQLLAVCILNLFLVLICLHLFRENAILKLILTLISGCTYIMILSSALRMLMYIGQYHLTFLRIFVLWSLAVIFFLISGVTIFIYNKKFPLFSYGMVIVTVFYIGLSFSHPDYWIAKYDLKAAARNTSGSSSISQNENDDEYSNLSYDTAWYLSNLSSDAAPVILNQDLNPYLENVDDLAFLTNADVPDTIEYNDSLWLQNYYKNMTSLSENMHLRNFNFSIYKARTYMLAQS